MCVRTLSLRRSAVARGRQDNRDFCFPEPVQAIRSMRPVHGQPRLHLQLIAVLQDCHHRPTLPMRRPSLVRRAADLRMVSELMQA